MPEWLHQWPCLCLMKGFEFFEYFDVPDQRLRLARLLTKRWEQSVLKNGLEILTPAN